MATVAPPQPTSRSPLPEPGEPYRLTVAQFDHMIQTATLGEDEAVELLNGILVTKMPKNAPHRVATRKTARALEQVLPAEWILQKEEAMVVPPGSKWEPDIAIVRSELEFDPSRRRIGSRLLPGRRGCRHQFPGPVREASNLCQGRNSRFLGRETGAGNHAGNSESRGVHRSRPVRGPVSHRVDLYAGEMVPVVINGQEVGQIAVADLLA